MHQRAVLAAGGGTLTDTLHIVWSVVTVLLMMLAIGVAAAASGKRFRLYSIATIVIFYSAVFSQRAAAPGREVGSAGRCALLT